MDIRELYEVANRAQAVTDARQLIGYMLHTHATHIPESFHEIVYRKDGQGMSHNAVAGFTRYGECPIFRDRVACVLSGLSRKGTDK